jgi:S1-C subfamily serine protease
MRVREKVGWAAWGAFALAVAFGVRGTFEAVRRGAGPAVMIRSRSVVASAAASNVSGGGTTSSRHNQSAGDVYDVFESPGPAVPFGVPGRAARPAGGGPVRAVGGQPFAPDQLFAAASPAVGVVEVKDRRLTAMGQGSGFFVSADGLLVTNYHVIAGGFAATVRSGEGRLFRVDGVAAATPRRTWRC